jgi:hypothetical protein
LRFWAFALAFFGLSGAALTWSAFGALTPLVVGMRGNVALVERSPASLPPIGGLSIGSKREDS